MMTEHTMMTAKDLSHTREWLGNRSVCHPEQYTVIINRLLATVDALTQRAERAEGEIQTTYDGVHRNWMNDVAYYKAHLEDAEKRCAEALALADARGRALAELVRLKDLKDAHFPGSTPEYEARKPAAWTAARETLALTAPEALRQQQEREAEKDALIERLRGAAMKVVSRKHPRECQSVTKGIQGQMMYPCTCGLDDLYEALQITPPQALHEWKGRYLEEVAIALSDFGWDPEEAERFLEALGQKLGV